MYFERFEPPEMTPMAIPHAVAQEYAIGVRVSTTSCWERFSFSA